MEQLEIIRRTIEQHHKIRNNLQAVGEAANDFEAVFSLQQSGTQWGQSSVQDVARNIENLKKTVQQTDIGLQRHFEFEEKYLPDVLGANLMKALLLEHNEIRDRLLKCTAAFMDNVSNSSREQLLSYRTSVQQIIDDLTGYIESHASREEIILNMIEKALHKEQNA